MELALPETTARLEAEVGDAIFTRGAQLAIRVGDAPAVTSAVGDDGRGRPVADDTVFRVYCTIKPVTAVAVARLVDAGELDLDEPLGGLVAELPAVAEGTVTLRDVLSHAAGLHRPGGVEIELIAPERRAAHFASVRRDPRFRVGVDVAYSERFAWHVLGLVLERVSGQPLREHLREAVLDPLGMADTWIGMTDEEYDAVAPRIGLNHDMRTQHSFPMLLERGRRMCTEVNPAHGGYTTATDLATFYAALVAQLRGAEDPALPSAETLRTFTSPVRPATLDRILDRECAHGLGFMVDLAGHEFGPLVSASSFGHSGNVGSSFAWADPDHDLAVAVIFNGIVDPASAFTLRPSVVRAIYRDLEAATAAEPEPDPEPEAPKRRRFGLGRR
ncbi:MAG: beta-lactamase family protein [Actinobacteria bacterium]|nr:beta-lactamase family protein [Actinomycetota bacterium]